VLSKDGGTFFWEINTGLQVQKQKYPTIMKTEKGTINLVPLNKEGYCACLMESTSYDDEAKKTVILVESKKLL
jgi:hypothetical protein